MRFALVGNPNSGKTTLFNEITGSSQYVGNWPGVTIEKKEGTAKRFKSDIQVTDLPGIYSLSPYSMEEIIARDYILDEKPDVVINIVDATNIERNLYLTTQLIELGSPVVIALNMMDAVETKGDVIDPEILELFFKVPVAPISASKGRGVKELMEKAIQAPQTSKPDISASLAIFPKTIEDSIKKIETIVSTLDNKMQNSRWEALKLLEGDKKLEEKLNVPAAILDRIKLYREKLEKEYDNDIETIIVDNRYRFISDIVGKAVKKKTPNSHLTISDRIDKVVTNRILAMPLFLAVMFLAFQATFSGLSKAASDRLGSLITITLARWLSGLLEAGGGAQWLHGLVIDGILTGVGAVLSFLPQIVVLFLFLSILEDSGYIARAAFIMDRLFRKLGLSGKAFIPMLIGFGCNVPAIMAARTMENEKDRKLTIMLTPFMSCSARLVVYTVFVGAFFSEKQGLVIFSLYFLGIIVAVLSGIILKNTVLKGEAAPFVMELPPYRIPTVKGLLIHVWDKAKHFIKKAATFILAASVVIWFFKTFNFSLHMVENTGDSIFGIIGKSIVPFFAPLGLGDWKTSVALLTGVAAKEVVLATMAILYGVGGSGENSVGLINALQHYFTPLRAYVFMAFTLLYVPCLATVAVMKREMNSWKWTFFALSYEVTVAWIVSFIIFQVGRLMGLS